MKTKVVAKAVVSLLNKRITDQNNSIKDSIAYKDYKGSDKVQKLRSIKENIQHNVDIMTVLQEQNSKALQEARKIAGVGSTYYQDIDNIYQTVYNTERDELFKIKQDYPFFSTTSIVQGQLELDESSELSSDIEDLVNYFEYKLSK